MKEQPLALDINCCRTIIVLFSAAVFVGCSGGDLGAEVSGNVTLDEKAIGPGVVIFAPLGGKENPAVGTIQPNGSYFVKTGGDVGIRPGTYRVCVQVHEQPVGLAPGERSMVPTRSLVPEMYTRAETSGLEYEVASGRNTIDLELTSDAAE